MGLESALNAIFFFFSVHAFLKFKMLDKLLTTNFIYIHVRLVGHFWT